MILSISPHPPTLFVIFSFGITGNARNDRVINGAEIADAVNLGIPVLCVYKREYEQQIFAYIRGKAGVVCKAYLDHDE